MNPIEKFKEIDQTEKRKYIVYGVFFLVSVIVLFLIYVLSGDGKPKDEEVAEMETAQTELEGYNTKLEALTGKKNQVNAEDLGKVFTTDSVQSEEIDFSKIDQEINNAIAGNNQPQQQNNSVANNGRSDVSYQGSNSHNVYGNYDMWQNNEPSNSQIGYSEKHPIKQSKQSKEQPKQQLSYDEISVAQTMPQAPTIQQAPTGQNSMQQVEQIPAQLISQGYIENGRILSFALKKPATIAGQSLPKNFVIQGQAKIQNDRIYVLFKAFKYKGKLHQIKVDLVDENGISGIPIARGDESEESVGESVAGDVVREATSRIPVVGGILSRNTGRRKERQKRSVESQPVQVYLMVYE